MRVTVISANLGGYEKAETPWVEQVLPDGVTLDIIRLTDENFPPRNKAMLPALQVGLPKWFGAELFPGAQVYIWIDASCALTSPYCVARWLEELGPNDLVVFAHPDRQTVKEEYEFIAERMQRPNERYLQPRYSGEWLDQEYEYICQRTDPATIPLYATTAFAYHPHFAIARVFLYTWLAKTKWHLHDQLAFAYELDRAKSVGVNFRMMPYNYLKCDLMEYVRNKKAAA